MEGSARRGGGSAGVAIIEFSDFQCPFCATFVKDTLPRLDKEYVATGKVLFAFRQLPLETIHPFAFKAAESAECAGRQDRFWQMHDLQFGNPKALAEPDILRYAKSIDLNVANFTACLAGGDGKGVSSKIRGDIEMAKKLGVSSTPTFLIGKIQSDGRVKVTARLSGAASFERFQGEIDKLSSEVPVKGRN